VDGCSVHPRPLGDVGQAQALPFAFGRKAAINSRNGRAGGPDARTRSARSQPCRSICPLWDNARGLGWLLYLSAMVSSLAIRSDVDSPDSVWTGFRDCPIAASSVLFPLMKASVFGAGLRAPEGSTPECRTEGLPR